MTGPRLPVHHITAPKPATHDVPDIIRNDAGQVIWMRRPNWAREQQTDLPHTPRPITRHPTPKRRGIPGGTFQWGGQ